MIPFPDKKYNVIVEMITPLGEVRIDLFARRKRDGWDVWGNEV